MSVTISGSGQIVKQVVSTTITGSFTTTSTSFVDVTGLTVTITPTNASNKIFVVVNGYYAMQQGGYGGVLKLVRNGTDIDVGNANGSLTPAFVGLTSQSNTPANGANFATTYLDSPATTSAVVYKIQAKSYSGGSTGTLYVGQGADTTTVNAPTSASTITVMEIAYA